jgi:hypothetical protein
VSKVKVEVMKAFSGVVGYYDQYMEETGHSQGIVRLSGK